MLQSALLQGAHRVNRPASEVEGVVGRVKVVVYRSHSSNSIPRSVFSSRYLTITGV